MRKVKLYIATSLDQYIARQDGQVDWLESVPNPEKSDYGYQEFYHRIDTTLMGHNTYKEILGFGIEFPYPDKTNYVFSRTTGHKDTTYVQYISGDIVQFTRNLKEKKGKDIWLVGGGQLNTLLLNNRLIDEIVITLFPLVLGRGIPLFAGNPEETMLELVKSEPFNTGILQLTYQLKAK